MSSLSTTVTLSFIMSCWVVLLSVGIIGRTEVSAFVGPITRQAHRSYGRSQQETSLEPEKILTNEQMNLLTELVQSRAEARWQGNYNRADEIRNELELIDLPDGYTVSLQDVPRTDGGGSSWSLVRTTVEAVLEGTTVLQLAHAALGLALASSEKRMPIPQNQLQTLVSQANARFSQIEAVEPELRGRKAADAAFWFSLAGANDDFLMSSLSQICAKELERFGSRNSCRGKDIWHILDRLAAAGIRNDPALELVGRVALESKGDASSSVRENLLDFHSDRCLMVIWKFSTRQRKQRVFLESALKHWERHGQAAMGLAIEKSKDNHGSDLKDWHNIYADPTKPLVIDIGCGMGVSLLGLAQQTPIESYSQDAFVHDWSKCNFAGVDLSGMAVGFGQGMAKRWQLEDKLRFFVEAAEDFLHRVLATYPGPIEFCLIQFPTPYRLPNIVDQGLEEVRGNSQLPADKHSGFMVSKDLLDVLHRVLFKSNGKLLIQSNCEDVAVWIKETSTETIGFQAIDCSVFDAESGKIPTYLTKRTLDWIAMGGERANGKFWSKGPILPRIGRTETEVACSLNGVPVHRCFLQTTCHV